MNRDEMIARVRQRQKPWDVIVIGGGATGAGVAVDAATRGYETLLVEREDFGKGTSSRSTKIVHGGVRYLEQGNIALVTEALKERGLLHRNAPHIVHDLPFIVPNYSWWEGPFYGIGLKVYDMLAGKYGFGASRHLTREETLQHLPTIKQEGLQGGVEYHDGQFDDTRLLTHLIATAADYGATVVNYAAAIELTKDSSGMVQGAMIEDRETGDRFIQSAKIVINATGIFTDQTRSLAQDDVQGMISPSQGIHLMFDRSFMPRDNAILVPHTSDGRVLFALPWHGHTMVGTTDTPVDNVSYEPRAREEEINFLLETAAQYLEKPPRREDILSIYTGIRPLVKKNHGDNGRTASLSRGHTIHADLSGLLTVTGGKWTIYRKMAEDCIDHAIAMGKLPPMDCITQDLRIHGYDAKANKSGHLSIYGTDVDKITALLTASPDLARQLHPNLPYIAAEIIWAVRGEMARTVEDVLARRTRALFLNARAAIAMAPEVADFIAAELGKDKVWQQQQVTNFTSLAAQYLP